MTDQIPLKANFTNDDTTSLGEFQTNDVVPILFGGTGATTASGARANLGLDNIDASTLDGQSGAYYLNYNNFSNTPTIGNGTLTVSGGSGLTGSGTFDANATTSSTVTIDHADTSTQSSVNNSGNTFVQDITLDDFGHITAITSSTVSGFVEENTAVTFTTVTADDFNSTSDARKKSNVETIADASAKVSDLRGVSFEWTESGESSIGIIAQEIEKVVPEVVSTKDDGFKSVSYGNLVGLLIEAIKDQQNQIDELKQKVDNNDK